MTEAASPPPNQTKAIQVLVVEDERVVARDIKACLENLGYTVPAIACSGEDAIEKARAIQPDIVLMDIHLEGEMDGTQAAQQIWSDLQIPIIYSTGYSDQITVERATATQPFGYILKPIKERDLYVAVKTALQRYHLEIKLKAREHWLTIVLRAIGDGVIIVDTQSRIKFLNVAAELMTGWQQEEAFDKSLLEVWRLVHEQTQEPILNPALEAIQTGRTVYLGNHTLLVTKSGAAIPIADSAAPFLNDDGTTAGVVLVFRDVTEHRLAAEQVITLQRAQVLEHQMEELQRLNQLKDDFLSTISHELRTPLSNIKLAIQMLEITLDRQNETDLETSSMNLRLSSYLNILREQCNQELMLINDLLDLQKLEGNAHPLEQTSIELEHWILHVMDAFRERTQRQQQRLQAILQPDLPMLVSDLAILTRILTELLTNAHKYTPADEEITVFASIENESYLHLKVCNTGVEIPANELTRIFDKFYRISVNGDRWARDGTGLGLALIKKMAAYLGGSIWAENGPRQLCFTVELPLTPPEKI
jgi:hypothetical protein